MKTLTSMIIAILLALAISISIKNNSLHTELNKLKEDNIRSEWIKASIENNDTIIIGDGCK